MHGARIALFGGQRVIALGFRKVAFDAVRLLVEIGETILRGCKTAIGSQFVPLRGFGTVGGNAATVGVAGCDFEKRLRVALGGGFSKRCGLYPGGNDDGAVGGAAVTTASAGFGGSACATVPDFAGSTAGTSATGGSSGSGAPPMVRWSMVFCAGAEFSMLSAGAACSDPIARSDGMVTALSPVSGRAETGALSIFCSITGAGASVPLISVLTRGMAIIARRIAPIPSSSGRR